MIDPTDLPAFAIAVVFSIAIVCIAVWDYRRNA